MIILRSLYVHDVILTLKCVTHCVLLALLAVCNVLTLKCITLALLAVCNVILTLKCVTFVTFVTLCRCFCENSAA